MKYLALILLTSTVHATSELVELKKTNSQASFSELQKKIKPGRLSPEKAVRLQKMISEGKYILPKRTESSLKVHQEGILNNIVSKTQKDIETNSESFPVTEDDEYKKFLNKIANSDKIQGPKKGIPLNENLAAPAEVDTGKQDTPEIVEMKPDPKKTKYLSSLQSLMNSKDEKAHSPYPLFEIHTSVYKENLIPQVIQQLK